MKCKNICNLPASADIQDNDGILITQNGKAVRMLMSALRDYIGFATGADVLGVPVPTSADAGKVPAVNRTGTGYELLRALTAAGGTMSGMLKTRGLALTYGVDYGPELPETGTEGQVFIVIDE